MKIGFDISQTGNGKAGCGFLAYSLGSALAVAQEMEEMVCFRTFGSDWWDPENQWLTLPVSSSVVRYALGYENHRDAAGFWGQPGELIEAMLPDMDIIHSNNFWCLPRMPRVKQVYTLHDMTVFECPEYSTEPNRIACANGVARAAAWADFIVANSRFTLDNFLDYFPFDKHRVAVIPLASRFTANSIDAVRPKLLHSKVGRFLLSVGTIEPRKNYDGLLEAFQVLSRSHDVHLVIAGRPGWNMPEFQSVVIARGLINRVTCLYAASDEELCWLYRNCAAFLCLSLWEGFGMPVIEAMSQGCPIVASAVSSIPEVLGHAGILVDPTHAEGIVVAVDRLMRDSPYCTRLGIAARERANLFEWSTAAGIVNDIYRELVP